MEWHHDSCRTVRLWDGADVNEADCQVNGEIDCRQLMIEKHGNKKKKLTTSSISVYSRPRRFPRLLPKAIRKIPLSLGADATHVCDIKGR